jgi:hypothetical protein
MTSHACSLRVAVGLAFAFWPTMGLGQARDLTLDERVTAQTAIEQIYWSHRIWPRENQGPKPALSEVVPHSAIRAKIEDTLKKSNAFQEYSGRSISREQLQAEIERMARDTHDPRMLQELFSALGNDPVLIAETIGRRALADRLLRDWYAFSPSLHGDLRRRAVDARTTCVTAGCMTSMGGSYQ